MKKFLLKIGLFFLCVASLVGLWGWYAFNIEPKSSDAYIAIHAAKLQRLDTLSSPRIVLVGGSNLAFGFDSRRLADSLGFNVQNMGVHASIGLRYMMDQTSPGLRKGDIVVILPEYEQFFAEYDGSGDIPAQALLYSPRRGWKNLNLSQIVNIIDGFPKMEAGRQEARHIVPDPTVWNYSALNFNDYGDETAHWKADSLRFRFALASLPDKPSAYAVRDFASKVKDWREKGCTVILLWPSADQRNYFDNRSQIMALERALAEEGIHFGCLPETFLHSPREMFDSDYHVRYPAVRANTDRLITILRNALHAAP